MVPARNAQTLSLVVHELATNAAKYGALSAPTGRVEVAWEVTLESTDQRFLFQWSESGGPPAEPPARHGFGSVILTSVIATELNCAPTLQFSENGLQYSLECSLSDLS